MADQEKCEDVKLLKSTTISVFVDEALEDMIVVTYKFGVKIFKGILLDYTKRNLPCGISKLHPAFTKTSKSTPDEDVLYSVNQRFAYTDPNLTKPKNVRIPSKYKNNKMTVRLRPRQVLCSKCKGICNENSENISKKRKSQEVISAPPKRSANAPVTRSVYSEQISKKKINDQMLQPSLIPKLSRLLPQDISDALNGNLENLNQSDVKIKKELANTSNTSNVSNSSNVSNTSSISNASNVCNASNVPNANNILNTSNIPNTSNNNDNEVSSSIVNDEDKVDHSIQHSESSNGSQGDSTVAVISITAQNSGIISKSVKRTLRKKRSIGSMEDLWDESVFEEGANLKNNDPSSNNGIITEHSHNNSNTCISTRTIKICYGPQGEGTVLKIPAPIDKFNVNDDSEENINMGNQIINKVIDNKAARKALKRARKKARQKRLLSGNSPSCINAMSPRYTLGAGSPRYTIGTSPRHYLGSNSPRYITTTTAELHISKRHKHKLKRKKKHRDDKDRKHKEDEIQTTRPETVILPSLKVTSLREPIKQITTEQENIRKEQAVTQKLSINLKRLQNTYTSCPNTSDKGEENSSSDEHNEQAPNFPPPNPPLILRVNAQTVTSAIGADGGRLLVGDVVWGKIHGFPWWPGKVLTITSSANQAPQAHVSWYGSSTSSLIQCDQLNPYLDNFKIRYNKKKRGAYKEAIRQATTEAKENAENRLRKEATIVSSPSQSIMTVPPPALASPREIDVMS